MFVLDTNAWSNFRDSRRSFQVLRDRILDKPPDQIALTIVTVQESLGGILSEINRALSRPHASAAVIQWYAFPGSTLRDVSRFAILPYDEAAERQYQRIPIEIRRRHPRDCRIAAIALANGCTIVTSNLRHFEAIPDLTVEDWAIESA